MKTLATLTVLLAISATALAGYSSSAPVVVTASYGYGALGSARDSADNVQFIGCTVQGQATSAASAYCWARDASSKAVSCATNNPGLISLIQSMPSDAVLWFFYDANGVCTTINLSNYSYDQPKH
jgi:hypothetical protein